MFPPLIQCSVLKDLRRLSTKSLIELFSTVCPKFNQTQNLLLQHSFEWNGETALKQYSQCFLIALGTQE